jgi:hypothetical protein
MAETKTKGQRGYVRGRQLEKRHWLTVVLRAVGNNIILYRYRYRYATKGPGADLYVFIIYDRC